MHSPSPRGSLGWNKVRFTNRLGRAGPGMSKRTRNFTWTPSFFSLSRRCVRQVQIQMLRFLSGEKRRLKVGQSVRSSFGIGVNPNVLLLGARDFDLEARKPCVYGFVQL